MATVTFLDVGRAHLANPNCSMRLLFDAETQSWWCIGCGVEIPKQDVPKVSNQTMNNLVERLKDDGVLTVEKPVEAKQS